ncbi:MAG: hypothetical protein ACOCX9_09465 [Spirochaetota bacterium]
MQAAMDKQQKLLSELAIAEKTMHEMEKKTSVRYYEAVLNAFQKNSVQSFMDLVMKNESTAKRLRRIARQEKLL